MCKMNSLCRLCKNDYETWINIFDPDAENGWEIWKSLGELLHIYVAVDDGLPQRVCKACARKVREFRDFKEMCCKNEEELKKLLLNKNLEPVQKKEAADSESPEEGVANNAESEGRGNPVLGNRLASLEGPLKEELVDVIDPQAVPSAVSDLEGVKHESPGAEEERDCQSALSSGPLKEESVDVNESQAVPTAVGKVEDVERESPNSEEENDCQSALSSADEDPSNDAPGSLSAGSLDKAGDPSFQMASSDQTVPDFGMVRVKTEASTLVEQPEGSSGTEASSLSFGGVSDSHNVPGRGGRRRTRLLDLYAHDNRDAYDRMVDKCLRGAKCFVLLMDVFRGRRLELGAVFWPLGTPQDEGSPLGTGVLPGGEGRKRKASSSCGTSPETMVGAPSAVPAPVSMPIGTSCEFRGETFLSADSLEEHRRKDHVTEVNVRENPGEGKKARLTDAMDRMPKDKAVEKTSQPVGSERTSERNGIIAHKPPAVRGSREVEADSFGGKHVEPPRFTCRFCGLRYRRENRLLQHLRGRTCLTPLKCHRCGERYISHDSLLRHEEEAHERFQPYRCQVCGMGFARTCKLQAHLRSHVPARRYRCRVCQRHECEDRFACHPRSKRFR